MAAGDIYVVISRYGMELPVPPGSLEADITPEIRAAVEAWADEVVPELSTYDDMPEDLGAAFPIAVASNTRDRVVRGDSTVIQQYEQAALRMWSVELLILVDTNSPTADDDLDHIVDTLGASLLVNRTLGGRVDVASPFYDADKPGEMEHPSGVVARAATFAMTVGKRVEVRT